MGTRTQLRVAGLAGVVTGLLFAAALAVTRGGAPAGDPEALLAWHAQHAGQAKAGAVLWLLAMLGLVVFAVALREATWASTADRNWVTVLFLQGAGLFATVAVAAAAVGWTLADQAATGSLTAETAAALSGLRVTLLRFATWGFTAPLALVALAVARHSLLGRICAGAGVALAAALLLPVTWTAAVTSFPSWLLLTGTALLASASLRGTAPVRHVLRYEDSAS